MYTRAELTVIIFLHLCLVAATFSLSTLIMSIWYLLFGKLSGYKIVQFTYLGFGVKRNDNGRFEKVKVPFSLMAVAENVRKNITKEIVLKYKRNVQFMLTLTLGTIASVLWYYKPIGKSYLMITEVSIAVVFILYLYDYISIMRVANSTTIDGRLWEQELITKNELRNGIRPKDFTYIEVPEKDMSIRANNCRLLNYYHLLDKGDVYELSKYIDVFKQIVGDEKNVGVHNIGFVYEIIYYYSIINPNSEQREYYYNLLEATLKNDMDINGRRVYAGYLIGNEYPDELTSAIISQGLSDECRNNESIPVDMEVDLLQSLQNRLNMA